MPEIYRKFMRRIYLTMAKRCMHKANQAWLAGDRKLMNYWYKRERMWVKRLRPYMELTKYLTMRKGGQ